MILKFIRNLRANLMYSKMYRILFPGLLLCCLILFSCSRDYPDFSKTGCNCDCSTLPSGDPLPEGAFNFLVTGDPQYNFEDMNPDKNSAINSDEISKIFAEKICCERYEGAVISGDLTHFSRQDELDRYHHFIHPFKPYAFDGLGNHDFAWAKEKPTDISAFVDHGLSEIISLDKIGWEESCLTIWEDVRSRKRIPEVNGSYPNVHYSWDWKGIHFVQLNLSAADDPVRYKVAQNPFKALTFLKKDLAKQVGNSGRPILIAHHYGFDEFSMGSLPDGTFKAKGEWWTAEDRRKYWEAIESYNVVAIFTGHAHYCKTCYLPWDGKAVGEENVGPDFIPTFVAGAAREGKYLDCQITSDSLIVKRFNLQQKQLFRKAFAIER